jgi:hypothetical protein
MDGLWRKLLSRSSPKNLFAAHMKFRIFLRWDRTMALPITLSGG